MISYIYDGSFEGLLSCIFTIYQTKQAPASITPEASYQPGLLHSATTITTDETLAARVLIGIANRAGDETAQLIYHLYLSEQPDMELLVYQLIRKLMASTDTSILNNFADDTMLRAAQIAKKISREVHRMHAFVRFQKTRDGFFYAAIDPDFNVLPLLGDHFERRYADQVWVILDTRRHYALHYDLSKTEFIASDDQRLAIQDGALAEEAMDEREKIYQALWENYFQAVNIKERKNDKLHLRHMPRRYWKYLIEKRPR
jgi:probable DNA metabolism protein